MLLLTERRVKEARLVTYEVWFPFFCFHLWHDSSNVKALFLEDTMLRWGELKSVCISISVDCEIKFLAWHMERHLLCMVGVCLWSKGEERKGRIDGCVLCVLWDERRMGVCWCTKCAVRVSFFRAKGCVTMVRIGRDVKKLKKKRLFGELCRGMQGSKGDCAGGVNIYMVVGTVQVSRYLVWMVVDEMK